jgi:SAM-dependent methyltransferase
VIAPIWVWHRVEHGGYDADLPVWRALAAEADGRILDLGAGMGRVAADLAARGHDVTALDTEAELLQGLEAGAHPVRTVVADARSFELPDEFALVIAPMQLVQILGGHDERRAMLERVYAHLMPGGTFAAALADPHDAIPSEEQEPPLPDLLEHDGWVFSSQPVSVREDTARVVVERRRQAVSPQGELSEEHEEVALDLLTAEELEREAASAGLTPVARMAVPETGDHIGSTVVVCRR